MLPGWYKQKLIFPWQIPRLFNLDFVSFLSRGKEKEKGQAKLQAKFREKYQVLVLWGINKDPYLKSACFIFLPGKTKALWSQITSSRCSADKYIY